MRVAVIGGGPSGMMAAIKASEAGAEVTLIEHSDRVGKKLLMTGNGKCNLSSAKFDKRFYNQEGNPVMETVFKKFGVNRTLSFMENIGVLCFVGKNDGYYPRSEQASVVLDALRRKMDSCHVNVLCDFKDYSLHKRGNGFVILRGKEEYLFDCVILCCGSKAQPATGSDGSGYALAEEFGHTIIHPLPALTNLQCAEGFFKAVSGVRQKGKIEVFVGQTLLYEESGEIQFTDTGISGIPVFQVSRKVAYPLSQHRKVFAVLDFANDYSFSDLTEYLENMASYLPEETIDEALAAFVNKKLATQIRKNCGFDHSLKLSELKENDFTVLSRGIKEFKLTLIKTGSYQEAQICLGGVSLNEVKENLESVKVKGLYFAGELLDVDGDCGGFNLQWAFSSGAVAGMSAAKE